MLQIFTKNRQNIFLKDFSGNAREFLIICAKTLFKYLLSKKGENILFSIMGMESKYFKYFKYFEHV